MHSIAGTQIAGTQIAGTQANPHLWLVIGAGAVALAAVMNHRVWIVSRTIITIAHEGGHALVALLTGRRLDGVRLHSDTSGLTVSTGRPTGPGMIATTAAGYTAPPLLGLGAAGLLATHHTTAMLLVSLVWTAALFVVVRNGFGMAALLVAFVAVLLVVRVASPQVQAGFAYAETWFLLFGGTRPVFELQHRRRRSAPYSDADQLAGLTGIPGLAWVCMFGLVAVGALAAGSMWMLT